MKGKGAVKSEGAKVSVIVPVYNGAKTLRRCVESILKQQYPNIELILVNDGSADESAAICGEYARADSRVTLISKKNSGVSDSRNVGIRAASGKYLQFVDCDDWLSGDATGQLVRRAEACRCDMVIANYIRVVDAAMEEKGGIRTAEVMTRGEYASFMMLEPANFYYGVMWNKLYRRSVVSEHHLNCCPELNWCEDFLFNLEFIRFAKRFSALQAPVYYYVKSPNSLAERQSTLPKAIKAKISMFGTYKKLFESMDLYEKNRLKVIGFLLAYAKDNRVARRPDFAPRRALKKRARTAEGGRASKKLAAK